MALFATADLHLSFGTDKPMDIFNGWQDYTRKIEKNWRSLVSDDDTVVIAGDISWAMHLENIYNDFAFLESLPGKKIIGKGNHDYWWETKTKMDKYIERSGFSSLSILFNNAYACGELAVCGTRGWSYDCPQSEQLVLLRECGRLSASIEAGLKFGLEPVVFLHYPPVYGDYRCDEIMEVLHKYEIKRCYYGHLHGSAHRMAVTGNYEGIEMKLIASDFCSFSPVLVEK